MKEENSIFPKSDYGCGKKSNCKRSCATRLGRYIWEHSFTHNNSFPANNKLILPLFESEEFNRFSLAILFASDIRASLDTGAASTFFIFSRWTDSSELRSAPLVAKTSSFSILFKWSIKDSSACFSLRLLEFFRLLDNASSSSVSESFPFFLRLFSILSRLTRLKRTMDIRYFGYNDQLIQWICCEKFIL